MNVLGRRALSGLVDAGGGAGPQPPTTRKANATTATVRMRRSRSLLPLTSASSTPTGPSFSCPSPYHHRPSHSASSKGNNYEASFWTWIVKPQKWSLLCLLLVILSVATACSFMMHSVLFAFHAESTSPWMQKGPPSPLSLLTYYGSPSAYYSANLAAADRKRNYSWVPPPRPNLLSEGRRRDRITATTASSRRFVPRVTYLLAVAPGTAASGEPYPVLWSLEKQYYFPDRNLSTPDWDHMDNNNDSVVPSTSNQDEGEEETKAPINSTDAGATPDNPSSSNLDFTTERADQCLPMAKWQGESFPNCNMFHELDWRQSIRDGAMAVLGRGWFRTTWMFNGTASDSAADAAMTTHVPLVLKTLRMEREFLAEYYELHRRDATAMERLTWSEFVVDIYGYCGQSAFNEMADFPVAEVRDLEKLNRRLRRRRGPEIDRIKLQLAASVAQGVTDIHSIDGHDRATMVHYDLNPRNIALFSRARPKINDFNIAEFLTYDPSTNATCGFPNRMHQPWWRAPEEVDTNVTVMLDERVDVYALCNILFSIYTTHAPRGKMKDYRMEGVRELVRAGIPPEIPPDQTESSISGVFEAIFSRCYAKDPASRGTAQEITDILVNELYNRLGKSKKKKSSTSQKTKDLDTTEQKVGAQKGEGVPPQDGAEPVGVSVESVGGDNSTNDDDDSADTTADAAERNR